ncbi:MAG: sigma-54 dependent transcriptional regulator [Syntrophobacteraceae bacterium]|jgi:transcriptional regulator with PAS, ATPase and Fis domain
MKDTAKLEIIGESPAFLEAVASLPQIAQSNSSVLIVGDTGTGKEVIARRIHQLSPRKHRPFVPINCGAIPGELAENELFGHKGGAFTGAIAFKSGLIAESEGGTLFLDEIDGFSPVVQVKLLRFLEEKTYRPLGDTQERQADVRVIAALNIDPNEVVRSGGLRLDLYYRLDVFRLNLPPLRERVEDIPLLAHHFLRKVSGDMRKEIKGFSQAATEKLIAHNWPGNVRELENAIERAVIFCDSEIVQDGHIVLGSFQMEEAQETFQETKARLVRQFEIEYIEKLLLAYRSNITRAAAAANKDPRAFRQLIRKYGINVSRFNSSGLAMH